MLVCMDKNCRVYAHRRSSNGKIFYIGIGQRDRPFSKHGRSEYWKNVVKKHGLVVQIVKDWSPYSCCLSYEKVLIFSIGKKNLCNMTDGGEGAPGVKRSKKWRKAMSERLKGPGNPCRGKPLSKEHKAKVSAALQKEKHPLYGRPVSAQRRAKISKALIGRKLSAEHKKAIGDGGRGRKTSESTKAKMSESKKKREIYTFQHSSGETFTGIRFDFIAENGLDPSAVTKLISGSIRSFHGWKLT